MKSLARWGARRLRSKPLFVPLLRVVWRYLRARTPAAGAAAIQAFVSDHGQGYPFVFRDRHGLEYILYPGENSGIYLANNGNYEVAETEFCLKRIQPGMTVFDVGANIGLYSLLFARQVGPQGRVHAFEPEPRIFRRLTVNLALNGCGNVTPNNAAVFSSSGPMTLNVFPQVAQHSLVFTTARGLDAEGRPVGPRERVTVPAVTLDEYCAANAVAAIDYLKVDVEGAEFDVLQGAAGLLQRQAVGVIQFEALGPSARQAAAPRGDVLALLAGCGFACHPIGPGGELLPPVSQPLSGYTNYAAVR